MPVSKIKNLILLILALSVVCLLFLADLIDTAEQKRLFLFPEHINASFAVDPDRLTVFSDPAVFDIMRLFFPAQHLL